MLTCSNSIDLNFRQLVDAEGIDVGWDHIQNIEQKQIFLRDTTCQPIILVEVVPTQVQFIFGCISRRANVSQADTVDVSVPPARVPPPFDR